jgi:hypothetical protein
MKRKKPWYEKSDEELFSDPLIKLFIFLAALLITIIILGIS